MENDRAVITKWGQSVADCVAQAWQLGNGFYRAESQQSGSQLLLTGVLTSLRRLNTLVVPTHLVLALNRLILTWVFHTHADTT